MRWLINILSNYLRFVVNMGVVFVMTPYIISVIGTERFGLWSLIFALVAMFGLLDAGFATTAVKKVAELWASQKKTELSTSLGTLMIVYLGLGLVCLLLIWSVAPFIAQTYELSSDKAQDFILALRGLGVVVALSFPLSLFRAILIGTGKQSWVNLTDLCFALLNAVGMYAALNQGWGLTGLALSTGLAMLGSFLIFIPASRLAQPDIRIKLGAFDLSELRELASFSIYVFVANTAMLIIFRIDPVIIAKLLTLEAVAVYAIAAKLAEYAYLLNKQFSNALMPLISQSNGLEQASLVAQVMTDGTRYLLAIAAPFLLLVAIFAPTFIELWVGASFAASGTIARLLMLGVFVSAILLLPTNVLSLSGSHRLVAGSMAIVAAINLVLSLVFIQYWGLIGAALGTVIATLIVETCVLLPRACRHIGLAPITFLRQTLGPQLLPSAVAAVLSYLLMLQINIDSLFLLLSLCCVVGLVSMLVFYFTGTRPAERAWFAAELNKRVPKRFRRFA